MASYKEGNERLSQTGGGMDGPELITYQEWVTKNVCKYYFELDDVLKNRPNVRPWFTNEKVMKPKDRVEKNSDNTHIDYTILDDCSTDSVEQELDTTDNIQDSITKEREEEEDTLHDDIEIDEYDDNCSISNQVISTNTNPITLTPLSEDNNSLEMIATINSSDDYTSPSESESKNKRKVRSNKHRKLLPSEAKGIQQNILKKKKKTIARNTTDASTNNIFSMDNDEIELIKQTRDAKMNFDKQVHVDLTKIQSEKLRIESERLAMDKSTMEMKKEQIAIQTTLEKNRLLLIKLDILKPRELLKKEFPALTEEYLNTHFPYPE